MANPQRGLPCIIRADFEGLPDVECCLQHVEKGDLAEVVDLEIGGGWAQVKLPSKRQNGYIPASYLITGDPNGPRIGQLTFDATLPDVSTVLTTTDEQVAKGPLYLTVTGSVSAITQAPSGPSLPGYVHQRFSSAQGIAYIGAKIVRGCKEAGAVPYLTNPASTVEEMTNLRSAHRDRRTGIYAILYHLFMVGWYIYIGKTAQPFRKRMSGHRQDRSKFDSPHYKMRQACEQVGPDGKKAGKWHGVVLCYLNDTDREVLSVAEQVFVMLFGSYAKCAFRTVPEDPTEINEVLQEDGTTVFAREWPVKYSANFYRQLARGVRDSSGWQLSLACSNFGATDGLNYSSPLNEAAVYEAVPWTRTQFPGEGSEYRRCVGNSWASYKSTAGKFSKRIWGLKTRKYSPVDEKFGINIPGNQDPPLGVNIHIVVCIAEPGHTHKIPYARHQSLGCWSDVADCNRLAIRFECYNMHENEHPTGVA